jgi:hypothetical protein
MRFKFCTGGDLFHLTPLAGRGEESAPVNSREKAKNLRI